MTITKQKTRKRISNLSLDIEIVNPIESKSLFGGCEYQWSCPCGGTIWWHNLSGILLDPVLVGNNGSGPTFGDAGNHILNGGYHNDWDKENMGNNYNYNSEPYDHQHYELNHVDDPFDKHICTQLSQSSTCATMTLSYVANYYGASGLTSSDFAEMVGSDYFSMLTGIPNPITGVFSDGLTSSQLSTIMNNIFTSTQISTYEQIAANANNGIPVLATLNLGGNNGHEIVITNLNLINGDMTYMDSTVGGPVTANFFTAVTPISFAGPIYAVTGVQNNATVNQYRNDSNDIKCSICGH